MTRELSFDEACSLTAGAAMWQSVAVPEAGVPSFTMADGPMGIASGNVDERDISLRSPCPTALGASFIEKHFILRRSDGGPDSSFSMEPEEMAALVRDTRTAFSALGNGGETRSDVEKGSLVFRRSIYVVRDIAAGEKLSAENVRIIRPGYGLAPKHMPELIGRAAKQNLKRGTALTWNMV